MADYNNFILSKSKIESSYLLIPNPFINDIYDIIKEFNENNDEIKCGLVFMDLQTIVGNRKKKYVSFKVSNYKIERSSKSVFNDVETQNELGDLKIDYYKKIKYWC